ncbi:tripartite tricarboxylate transporter substrate binding protein [Ramlibacter sp. AW1]|uniref:Tripartite tricarboxylate transporter substrate binding protein n=1 Tax=Ramlibacter aurantiacus TaxID=2801330 RepID=A0A936ZEY0_9BURK|nr:tripartite tricarboxylate transporter substrate binding protein [Ramlibacter aurantiacus]MBL0420294.1 tripartite tricarboxylate transporter substrate binding protein [Ramlibacter aurantiacus]
MKPLSGLCAGLLVIAGLLPAHATEFPTKPIRFVVPFTPGTGMDRIARLVAEDLKNQWGQPVTVENRTGAAGHVGAQLAAKAPADGHTVLVTASNISITATLVKSAGFDAMSELKPLLIAAYGDSSLVVGGKSKFNNLADVMAAARSNPGGMRFATPGSGSPMHLAMAEFEDAAQLKFLHIPYKGTAPAVTDLIAGHVDVMFVASHTVKPFVDSGQLKLIAVGAAKRNPLISATPTFAEAGVPNVSTEAWYGFMIPRDVPEPVRKKLFDGISSALDKPSIKSDLQATGLQVRPSTSEEMQKYVQAEFRRYAALIDRHKITNE